MPVEIKWAVRTAFRQCDVRFPVQQDAASPAERHFRQGSIGGPPCSALRRFTMAGELQIRSKGMPLE
jgi:hypothetical protein